MDQCIFCHSGKIKPTVNRENDTIRVECPSCNFYIVPEDVVSDKSFDRFSQKDKILFSGHLSNFSTKANPMHTNSDIDIESIVAPYKNYSTIDKVEKVLQYFGEKSEYINSRVNLSFDLYTRFFCLKTDELIAILSYLKEKGYLRGDQEREHFSALLTIPGWERYEQLKQINSNSKKVFVAMSFDMDLDEIYQNAIVPACQICRFDGYRVDLDQHNEKICDKIIAEIKRARFIIVDFTKQKHNVYYEAGFARGLGLPVIWCCKKEEAADLKFDIRQYNHILWTDSADFKLQLINRISATI